MTEVPAHRSWLDSGSEGPDLGTLVASVTRADLLRAADRLLGECLVAQRLMSVSGLRLEAEDPREDLGLAKWGDSFASAVAVVAATRSGSPHDQQRQVRLRQRQVLTAQNSWPDLASVSSSTFLLCTDHTPSEYGLPAQLYARQESRQLVSWNEFAGLVDRLIAAVSPSLQPAWLRGNELKAAISTILYETFKNTHDHARTEVDGAEVAPSVRGLFAKFYPLDEALASLAKLPSETLTPVERYVRGFEPRKVMPGAKGLQPPAVSGLLEISVLDSGPGMAARWLRRSVVDLPALEQAEAVLACFGKGHSTSGAAGRGFGLWKVLHSLAQLHGFISVRTNGVHLFRPFVLMPRSGVGAGFSQEFGAQALPKEFFYDWQRGISTSPSACPQARGTVVSYLLPMGME